MSIESHVTCENMVTYGYRTLANELHVGEHRPRTYRELYKLAMPRILQRRYGENADRAARVIQRAWLIFGRIRIWRLRGPACFYRELAENATDPWTLAPVAEIPLCRFWSYQSGGRVYGMDVIAAHRWFCRDLRDSPFDRTHLSLDRLERLERCARESYSVSKVQRQLLTETRSDRMPWIQHFFHSLNQSFGLIFDVDGLMHWFVSLDAQELFVLYQQIRWWALFHGPKTPEMAHWLAQSVRPRQAGVEPARAFVARGIVRLVESAPEQDRGTVLLMLGHLLQGQRQGVT